MRIVDAFLSLPWILKMLVLIVTFGTGIEVSDPHPCIFLRHSGNSYRAGCNA